MVGNRKKKVVRRGERGLQVPEQGRVGRGEGEWEGQIIVSGQFF